ncbi:hypothetical protein [Sphingomonas sp. Leaf357]|uniref:hypothetical protein n=1 Tax=Sphingomonas sp. Leaf357 TaxID=1736350 RepID=UPI001F403C58|nr:hypothetical protein [Sphingomonas sp. Leaf357]
MMADAIVTETKQRQKLKFEDRFQPAKRNLTWVAILSVALAFADTSTQESAKGTVPSDSVKIPGLDVSFHIGLAGTFLLIAIIYCFVEYLFEYQTTKIENSEAAAKTKDISLSDLFEKQSHTIQKTIAQMNAAAESVDSIPARITEAVSTWQNSLRPDTMRIADEIRTIANGVRSDLASALGEEIPPESQIVVQEIVQRRLIQPFEERYRVLAGSYGRDGPRNPPPMFSNTDSGQISEHLKTISGELDQMDKTQKALAKDFSSMNSNLYDPQRRRFFWVDAVVPHACAVCGAVANIFVISRALFF